MRGWSVSVGLALGFFGLVGLFGLVVLLPTLLSLLLLACVSFCIPPVYLWELCLLMSNFAFNNK